MSNQIKPEKLSLHEFLIRKAAVKVMQSESIVEKVISHQHQSINKAFKTTYEIEITGFCKFKFSQSKLRKNIRINESIRDKLLLKLQNDPDNQELAEKLRINTEILTNLYPHLKEISDENRLQGSTGGNEEQLVSTSGDQGENRGDSSSQDSNL